MRPDARRAGCAPGSSAGPLIHEQTERHDSQRGTRTNVTLMAELRRCAVCRDFHTHGEADRYSAVPACRRCAFRAEHEALRRAYIEDVFEDMRIAMTAAPSQSLGDVAFEVHRLAGIAMREALVSYVGPEQIRRRA